jgi:hypothetical protein
MFRVHQVMDACEKKKRGRKPKTETEDVLPTDEVEKKKRGRKPKSVYNVSDTTQASTTTTLSDDENIIVRLHVTAESDTDVSDDPHAYNKDTYHTMEIGEFVEPIDTSSRWNDSEEKSTDGLKVVHVLKDFEEKNKNNEWPTNTSICCYWCCHKFDNAPYGIPVSYHNQKFDVYGCFCSLECAAAYNFKSSESLDEIWERYNLINLLARKINYYSDNKYCGVVKAAPERLTLKSFGGFMEIDEFRNYNKTQKVINVNFPPMTSLTQQIEEINEYELNSELRYIPLDSERINRCKEKMMFKRNKPVVNDKSTLESAMNLRICS